MNSVNESLKHSVTNTIKGLVCKFVWVSVNERLALAVSDSVWSSMLDSIWSPLKNSGQISVRDSMNQKLSEFSNS